ncbi:hypothetical protein K503DRAFT_863299 [Rhizopogon vinicolor AM-OR11-026]|uniref:Ubiquitin-like protease family profile domain-containing protein n=1 Tax=Rhizopogon vinicolor AM-OR11-026 TaxID=1314800 RepID=A0A1B7NB75_9AGAM|nr:hypothetical protein K503DRAFT_863299 [Rhizopogon vinicolor AM-OR11-026]
MVEFSTSQRQQVNSLHGTSIAGPSNFRDASSNSTGPWKNAPTLIAQPSQARNSRGAGSPYDGMSNTFRQQQIPGVGNPITRATLLTKRPTSKRSKPDLFPQSQSRHRRSNSRLANSIQSSSIHTRHPVASTPDVDIQIDNRPRGIKNAHADHRSARNSEIVEISDEEDLGAPLPRPRHKSSSPDPLGLTSSIPHDFETRPGDLRHADPRKGKGKDVALKPQSAATVISDIEEIEDFTSEPANDQPSAPRPFPSQPAAKLTPSLRTIKPGTVAKKREFYEPSKEPFLDLRGGVVRQMKCKVATKPVSSTSQLDPIATESTLFTSRSLPRTKEPLLKLPLRAWAMGLKIFLAKEGSDPPVFQYDPQNGRVDVSVPGQSNSYWSQHPNGFEGITVTNDSERTLTDNVVIQLRTRKDCDVPDHGLSELEFQPGSTRPSGRLTFVFSTDKVEGWTTTYQKLVSFLTKSTSNSNTVRPAGGKALWEEIKQGADMYQLLASRSSESRRKSITPSVKNASPPRPLRNSTGNSRTRLGPDTEPPNEASSSAPLRRSSRRSAAVVPETSSESPPLADPEELILVYPPSGPGALNIMGSDLNRLRPYEYLNDTLIEFGLKLWLTELAEQDKDLADQIHVFSSFFYKKLNNKRLEEGYQSVRKWTSKVDIFSKKYIIVPINENLHWYLAIIYEPEHTLQPPLPQKEQSLSQRSKLRRQNVAELDVHADTQKELSPTHDIPPAEGPSEPDAEMSSLRATCASTPSITQDEEMDDISPIEFTQSCSISNIPDEKPRSASSSKPVSMRGRSASVGKASRRSMSVEAPSINEIVSIVLPGFPRLDSMDVDASVIDVEADQEGPDLRENIISSKASTSTDTSDPPSTLSSKPPSRGTGIPPTRFYGPSSGRKGKQKAESVVVPDSEEENEGDDDEKQEKEVDVMLGGALPSQTTRMANDPPKTRIFTLDSLGTHHPQALKTLKYWLKAEAKDKRQVEEVRLAQGKFVQVPSQPNFADCGIYLLHFAKTFLSKPAHYFAHIYQPRKIYPAEQRRLDWDEAVVQHYREDLIQRITQLSGEWKASRAAREEDTKRKRKSEELGQAESDSSEVEVDIVEDIKVPRTLPKPVQRPAKRLRGG